MHHAPAADYPLISRATVLRWVLLLWTVSGLPVAGWFWLASFDGGWKWLGLMGVVAAALTAISSRNRIAQGLICWDGVNWGWTADGCRLSGMVTVELDLQFLMLLAFVPDGPSRQRVWMFLGGRGARWLAVRRAAFATRNGFGGHSGGPGPEVGDVVRGA